MVTAIMTTLELKYSNCSIKSDSSGEYWAMVDNTDPVTYKNDKYNIIKLIVILKYNKINNL